jgi:hypothetical protein
MKATINKLNATAMKAIALDTLFGDYDFETVVRTLDVLVEWNNTRDNDEIGKYIEEVNNRAWAMFEKEVTK